MKNWRRFCLVIGTMLLLTWLVTGTSRAVTIKVETSGGSSTTANYCTRDGDWVSGNATVSPTGAIEHAAHGYVERGFMTAESPEGARAFTPYTGDFTATASAGTGGGATTSATSANARVDIFVVTQPLNTTLQGYSGATYADIITAVGAATGDGGGLPDWILVDQGTYDGPINIADYNGSEANSALTSVWGRDDTTIDAGGALSCAVEIDNSQGFTIEGFTVTGASEDGINVDTSPDAWILCNTATNNLDDGIEVNNSDGVTIRNNNVTDNGNPPLAPVPLADHTINSATTFDGISVSNSNNARITNNNVTHNHGLGISVSNSQGAWITNNNVTHNGLAPLGISAANDAPTTNFNGFIGGGIEVSFSDDVRIANNNVTHNRGVGISVSDSQDPWITNNNVANNGGRLIAVPSSNGAQMTVDMSVNLPAVLGGGGGISVFNSQGAHITNNNVANNGGRVITVPSSNAGQMTADMSVNATLGGGGISVFNSDGAWITNNHITNNGATVVTASAGNDTPTTNNFTVIAGGGLTVSSSNDAQIANNTITGNAGHGVSISDSDGARIRNNTIQNNQGIGIDVLSGTDLRITRNTITGNGTGPIENLGGIALGPTATGVTIRENNIERNRDYGLWNSGPNDVDATNNWWGPGTAGPGPSYDDTPPYLTYVDIRDQGNNVDFSDWAGGPFAW